MYSYKSIPRTFGAARGAECGVRSAGRGGLAAAVGNSDKTKRVLINQSSFIYIFIRASSARCNELILINHMKFNALSP